MEETQKIKIRIHTPHRIVHYSKVLDLTEEELERYEKIFTTNDGWIMITDNEGQKLCFAPALLSQCVKTIIYLDKEQ